MKIRQLSKKNCYDIEFINKKVNFSQKNKFIIYSILILHVFKE